MPPVQDERDLAVKYSRALEQIELHRREVQELLAEGKRLEKDNAELREDAVLLRRRNTELEQHQATLLEDYAKLEVQVKQQQLRLQHFIDATANDLSKRSRGSHDAPVGSSPSPGLKQAVVAPAAADARLAGEVAELKKLIAVKNARLEELQQRVSTLDESRLNATSAAETYKESAALLEKQLDAKSKELAALHRELAKEQAASQEAEKRQREKEAALQTVISQLREHQSVVARESMQIEEVESKAKEGMRLEWVGAIAECDRLSRVAEIAEATAAEAKSNQERLVSQMESQRRFIDESNELATKEMKALHLENTLLMEDLRCAIEERDSARLSAAKSLEQLKRQHNDADILAAAREARAVVSSVKVDRATQLDADSDPAPHTDVSRPIYEPVGVDFEAMRELELAVSEWRSLAEGAREELAAARAAHRSEAEERAKEVVSLSRKTFEVAEKLKEAYREIDALRLREVERSPRKHEPPHSTGLPHRGGEVTQRETTGSNASALQLLAGAPPEAHHSTIEMEEYTDCVELLTEQLHDCLVTALQTRLLLTAAAGNPPSAEELSHASDELPVVHSSRRFRKHSLNDLLGHMGGLRYVLKSIRSDVWSASKRRNDTLDPKLPAHEPTPNHWSVGELATPFVKMRDTPAAKGTAKGTADTAAASNPAGPDVLSESAASVALLHRAAVSDRDTDDDLEALLQGNSTTLATLSGQLRWENARLEAFRAHIERLRAPDDA